MRLERKQDIEASKQDIEGRKRDIDASKQDIRGRKRDIGKRKQDIDTIKARSTRLGLSINIAFTALTASHSYRGECLPRCCRSRSQTP